eukprot:766066-Hanusia_phi.AAC.6
MSSWNEVPAVDDIEHARVQLTHPRVLLEPADLPPCEKLPRDFRDDAQMREAEEEETKEEEEEECAQERGGRGKDSMTLGRGGGLEQDSKERGARAHLPSHVCEALEEGGGFHPDVPPAVFRSCSPCKHRGGAEGDD